MTDLQQKPAPQEARFSSWLSTGEGLSAFSSENAALEAIEERNADYDRHAQAARGLAEEYLDSDNVLTRLLDAVSR